VVEFSETSYRYHFKQWGWTTNVSSVKKDHILQQAQARAMQGKLTTAVVAGRKVDVKRLRRQVKTNARQEHTILDASFRLADHQYQVFGDFLPFGNKMSLLPLSPNKNYADEVTGFSTGTCHSLPVNIGFPRVLNIHPHLALLSQLRTALS
jgi:hypothetical protein